MTVVSMSAKNPSWSGRTASGRCSHPTFAGKESRCGSRQMLRASRRLSRGQHTAAIYWLLIMTIKILILSIDYMIIQPCRWKIFLTCDIVPQREAAPEKMV